MIRDYPLAGIGVGAFHTVVHYFALESAGLRIPPDNAQNWFRHQLAEFGILGSIGWVLWVVTFLCRLGFRSGERPEAALRGPIIGLTLASLVGMPGQDPAVALTFWVLAFWYAMKTGERFADPRMSTVSWSLIFILAGAYTATHALSVDLRPPFRAARYDLDYTYRFDFNGPRHIWTAGHAVTVPLATDNWLKLTYWVEHPDADQNRVQVDIWRDGEHIVDRRVSRNVPVTQYVPVTAGKRFVLEVKVDRTFVSDGAERGLAMRWEFVPNAPGR